MQCHLTMGNSYSVLFRLSWWNQPPFNFVLSSPSSKIDLHLLYLKLLEVHKGTQYNCVGCEKWFSRRESLKTHINTLYYSKTNCVFCDLRYKSPKDLSIIFLQSTKLYTKSIKCEYTIYTYTYYSLHPLTENSQSRLSRTLINFIFIMFPKIDDKPIFTSVWCAWHSTWPRDSGNVNVFRASHPAREYSFLTHWAPDG